MSLRFRKSFKLAPGLRLNMSKSGFGFSVGPRGASMSFGPRGNYQNINLPGGFSYRSRIGHTASQSNPTSVSPDSQKVSIHVKIGLENDGTVTFMDQYGDSLSPSLQDVAKKQQGDTIKAWLKENCEEINEKIAQLDAIHASTSAPWQKPIYTPIPFTSEPPDLPRPKDLGILGHFLPWVKRRIETDNATTDAEYDERLTVWRNLKASHENSESERRTLLEERLYREPEVMQLVLQQRLAIVPWPRETDIAIEITEGGKSAIVDVDLPEIEDVPRKTVTYGGRGWKVSIKELSDFKVTQLYMRHVHGIAFRVIGETFAALPTVKHVVLSGYSQRSNKVTGKITDEYIYSVKVSREQWSKLNFENLSAVDVTESLSQFELRREMSKSGRFTAIEPFVRLAEEPSSR